MNLLPDLPNQAPGVLVQQIAAATTGTTAGSSADMSGKDGRCHAMRVLGVGVTGNTPVITTKMQESTDGTTWTDIQKYSIGSTSTGQTVTFSTTAATDATVDEIMFDRSKRYIRPSSTITGTGTLAIPLNIIVREAVKPLN